jgi:hypothetical protein
MLALEQILGFSPPASTVSPFLVWFLGDHNRIFKLHKVITLHHASLLSNRLICKPITMRRHGDKQQKRRAVSRLFELYFVNKNIHPHIVTIKNMFNYFTINYFTKISTKKWTFWIVPYKKVDVYMQYVV